LTRSSTRTTSIQAIKAATPISERINLALGRRFPAGPLWGMKRPRTAGFPTDKDDQKNGKDQPRQLL
jgi:hypothetical protein